jgi:DNA polymerase-3 subunit alpha
VIAVETAYLKTHFTVEYMTALLSASKNDTAKVAFYVADCRSLGIDVLPPDINSSGWDFSIEDCEGKCAAIRFGMGAVKNVGQGPVDLIAEARKDGKFKDLNDFLRRVDLRTVGKRSLECLIRVGALDCFGPRKALMEVMDSMASLSASHFRALQSGQMSFFGTVAGVEESIQLPPVSNLDPREQLDWEKELIGLYVSDHPLNRYQPLLQGKVTHLSADLGECSPNDKVTIAGLVTRMRTLTTKTGKPMAFATIEDMQGPIELVIFPNTWTKYGHHIHNDGLVIVDGKVDATSADPKILVDSIKTLSEEDLAKVDVGAVPKIEPPVYRSTVSEIPMEEPGQDYESSFDGEVPPPPLEPDDWHLMPPPMDSNRGTEVVAAVVEVAAPVAVLEQPVAQSIETMVLEKPIPTANPLAEMPPMIISPRGADSPLRRPQVETKMVTVILKSTGEKERDVRRLKRVHGLLRAAPGSDHFCLMIHENGFRHFLDFPNDTTGANADLLDKLVELVGSENVQVDNVRLQ